MAHSKFPKEFSNFSWESFCRWAFYIALFTTCCAFGALDLSIITMFSGKMMSYKEQKEFSIVAAVLAWVSMVWICVIIPAFLALALVIERFQRRVEAAEMQENQYV